MTPSVTLNPAIAAQIAASAIASMDSVAPDHSLQDLVVHLCGALGWVLLMSAELETAVAALDEWQGAMRDILHRLDEVGLPSLN